MSIYISQTNLKHILHKKEHIRLRERSNRSKIPARSSNSFNSLHPSTTTRRGWKTGTKPNYENAGAPELLYDYLTEHAATNGRFVPFKYMIARDFSHSCAPLPTPSSPPTTRCAPLQPASSFPSGCTRLISFRPRF